MNYEQDYGALNSGFIIIIIILSYIKFNCIAKTTE